MTIHPITTHAARAARAESSATADGTVRSATLSRIAPRGARGRNRRDSWESTMSIARSHLKESHEAAAAGNWVLALEQAYRAGLRTAAARFGESPVAARRKRLPTSVWDQLSLVDAASAEWAARVGAYSRMRSRLLSGMDREVEPEVVRDVQQLVTEFYDDSVAVHADHVERAAA